LVFSKQELESLDDVEDDDADDHDEDDELIEIVEAEYIEPIESLFATGESRLFAMSRLIFLMNSLRSSWACLRLRAVNFEQELDADENEDDDEKLEIRMVSYELTRDE